MNGLLHSLITVAVIATIMTFFVLGPIIDFLERADRAAHQMTKKQIATALEIYYTTNGRYPSADSLSTALEQLHTQGYISKDDVATNDLEYHVTESGTEYSFRKPTSTKTASEKLYRQ